ncbi:MAG TPA: gamma-glutamyl-gamma-aminobutyrate hydrolase family protein [Solirubrobacteraceae bacterium]|nr:gamma-glutamyl-gamma-aminobutyrate hydrolase family protein [Solirubrobacteraceae bacterium]
MELPAIGITAAFAHAEFGVWSERAAVLPAGYVEAVQRAGGLVLILAPDASVAAHPDEVLERIDGLIISGGSDVDPAAYGAERDPATGETDPERDAFEIALARGAIERGLPLLAICRGMQILNVALGGTLLQHLPDALGHTDHRRVLGSFAGNDHAVHLAPGSLAARAAGEEQHTVKSHHHQGVDRLGSGLIVSGTSAIDPLVEAIELPGDGFVLGVQWHPEADESSRVIAALVQAADERRRRDARSSTDANAGAGADAGAKVTSGHDGRLRRARQPAGA